MIELDEDIVVEEEPYVEELQKVIPKTELIVMKGLARENETITMKFVEIKKFDESIEIGFLEKAGYYVQVTWKLIKIIYPIIIPLLVIFRWIESLKTKKEQ